MLKFFKFLFVLLLFLLLPWDKIEAEENSISVVYEGKLYEISGAISEGVTTVLLEDMMKIISYGTSSFCSTKVSERDIPHQISIRKFAEHNDLKVVWEGNTKTIVLTKNANASMITESDTKLLTQLLAHDWFRFKDKKELLDYFSEILISELAREVAEKVWNFLKEPTDWYWTYELDKLCLIDQGNDFRVILATIMEIQDKESRQGYGLFTLEQQITGEWIITGMRFIWPE